MVKNEYFKSLIKKRYTNGYRYVLTNKLALNLFIIIGNKTYFSYHFFKEVFYQNLKKYI